ncbi:MAG: flagellar biosynthesis regulator FlaF [Sneathiella sp.]|nr:flagellar biosynthesis regulator FlaF [Sneathiella sp.]
MYFEAYKKANLAVEKPKATEYRLFAEITRELEIANTDSALSPSRINALFRNNQLWLTIQIDLSSSENKLDINTKAGLISLAIWVSKFTTSARNTNVDLEPLITVNRQIMGGLSMAVKSERKPSPPDSTSQFKQMAV